VAPNNEWGLVVAVQSGGLEYAVDLVLCIDKTGSMSPVIDKVKKNALRLHDDLKLKLDEKHKAVSQLRVRVIAFGDIYADKDKWLQSSEFFSLPDQADTFKAFVSKIVPEGGGDEPENGLEALSLAINSSWTSEGHRRRHVVVMWTDASAHKLEKRADSSVEVAEKLPKDFNDLSDLWNGQAIDQNARRLVIFGPEAYPWSDLMTHWEQTYLMPTRAGDGMREHEYDEILHVLANSI
jgi:hypothetical protein